MNSSVNSINETFIIEPLSLTGGSPTLSACTALYTDNLISCTGNAEILLSTGQTIFNTTLIPLVDDSINLGSSSNKFGNIFGTTISATTYLNLPKTVISGGTNVNVSIITGTTYINVTNNPIFNSLTASTFYGDGSNLINIKDTYVTGGTYSNGTATFTNNTGGTFSISGFDTSVDTFITGFTYNNNQFTLINSTGGTISVIANVFSAITSTTISASTYQGLPIDVRVTGGTVNRVGNNSLILFTNNTGGTFNVSSIIDTFVTGGTYSNGIITFTNNSGNTFNVSGFSTGNTFTDTYVTGGTPDNTNHLYTFTNNTGGTFNVTALIDITVTGGTYSNGSLTLKNNTGGTFTISGLYTGATDVFVTGGTTNRIGNNTTLTFTNNTGGTFNISSIIDTFITGGTYSAGTLNLINNSGNTVSITGLSTVDTFITGFTYNNNLLTIKQNQGQFDLSVLINTMTGLTVNGNLSATTGTIDSISGSSSYYNNYYSGTTNLLNIFTTNTYINNSFLNLTGGTLSGGLTATTISATTYQNLPTDIRVTGGTYSAGTATFTNNTGGTFTVNGFDTSVDTYVTGGTPDNTNHSYIFTNSTGGTFTVSGLNDINTTAFTYNNNQFILTNSTGGTLSVLVNTFTGLTATTISATTYENLPTDITITGGTYDSSTGIETFVNNTGGTFNVTGLNNQPNYYPLTGGTLNGDILVIGDAIINGSVQVLGTASTFNTQIIQAEDNNIHLNYSGSHLTANGGGVIILSGISNSQDSSITIDAFGNWSATTSMNSPIISATTYLNLPLDISITGGTSNNTTHNYTFTNNTGGTFNVTGLVDVVVTGGTYNNSTGIATFTNNTGGTFTVSGFFTSSNDIFVTGGTANNSNHSYTFTNNTGGTFNVIGLTDVTITGGTYNSSTGTATFTNNTGGTFTTSGFFTSSNDVHVTAFTYNNNLFTITDSTGGTFNTLVNTFTGLTATTVSATTYQGLPTNIVVTGGTYNSSTGIETFTNNTGGTFSVTGFTTGTTSAIKTKSGIVAFSAFTGTELAYNVIFITVFSDALYSPSVIGEDLRPWSISNRTASGFTINSNSTTSLTGNTYWTTIKNGEN